MAQLPSQQNPVLGGAGGLVPTGNPGYTGITQPQQPGGQAPQYTYNSFGGNEQYQAYYDQFAQGHQNYGSAGYVGPQALGLDAWLAQQQGGAMGPAQPGGGQQNPAITQPGGQPGSWQEANPGMVRSMDFQDSGYVGPDGRPIDVRDLPYAQGAVPRGGQPPPGNNMQLPPGVPPTGLIGAEQAFQGGLYGGLNALGGGLDQAESGVRGMIGAGVGGYQPYIQQGQQANSQQSALSGAMGPEAQQRAYDAFISSPGQAWLREKGERAVTRNASALGGLGGGRVQQELQRQGQGLAAQDFENSFARLGTLSDRGMQGAIGAGNLYGQGASMLGNIGLQGGLQASNMFQNTGTNIANARTQAGRDIAGGVAGTTSDLANLINERGTGFAEMYDQSGGNIAEFLAKMGESGALNEQQLAALMAQLSQGAGGQVGSLPPLAGNYSPGTTDAWGNLIDMGATAWDTYQNWGTT